MTKEENIIIPRWFLENIENTLRIQNNINLDKKECETCQDRNIRQCLIGVRKLLNGEELTGSERYERLPIPPHSDLDNAAFDYAESCKYEGAEKLLCAEHYKAGAEWMANQGHSIQGDVLVCPKDGLYVRKLMVEHFAEQDALNYFSDGDKVIIQIRKKE